MLKYVRQSRNIQAKVKKTNRQTMKQPEETSKTCSNVSVALSCNTFQLTKGSRRTFTENKWPSFSTSPVHNVRHIVSKLRSDLEVNLVLPLQKVK